MEELNPVRWTVYLVLGPIGLAGFLLMRSNYRRALALLAVLIFIENVFLGWRRFLFVGASLSGAFAYVWFAVLLFDPVRRVRMPAMSPAWGVFLFFALVGAAIGVQEEAADLFDQVPFWQVYYLEAMLYFFIGRAVLDDSEEAVRLLRWLAIFGGGVALLHMFSLSTGYTFYAATAHKYAGGIEAENLKTFRYGGVFANPNALADFYAMVLPVTLVSLLGWRRPTGLVRLAIIASMGLMLISLPLTASRGGFLASVVTLSVALVLLPLGTREVLNLAAAGIVAGGMALMGLLYLFPDFFALSQERFDVTGLGSGRLHIWSVTAQVLARHPFGVGLNPMNYLEAVQGYGVDVTNPHSIYFSIAIKAGLLGLAAFLVIIGHTLLQGLRARLSRDPAAKTAGTGLFLLLLGFLVGGLTEPIFSSAFKLQHIFFLLAGVTSSLPVVVAAAHQTPSGRLAFDPERGWTRTSEGAETPERAIAR